MPLTDNQQDVKDRAQELGYTIALLAKKPKMRIYCIFDPAGKPVFGTNSVNLDECWANLAFTRGKQILATD